MHVALFCPERLPVRQYGGTERIVVYLARGLAEAGHLVTLLAAAGSSVPEATLAPIEVREARRPGFDVRRHMPSGVEIVVAFAPLGQSPDLPWIRSLHGNRKPGTANPPNTLYLSRDHALRHGGTAFVYNGIDPTEFHFRREKADYDLFLGRFHSVKGRRWAIEGAKQTGHRLLLAGGWRPSVRRSLHYVGKVGGERKAELLAGARCLWMPALWDEPFGLTLIEAMVSGTPVLGSRRGALPEIVTTEVGALGDTLEELVALRPGLDRIEAGACRAWIDRHFTYHTMASEYLRMFREFAATGVLPPGRTIADHA